MKRKTKFLLNFSIICGIITIVVSTFSLVFYYNSKSVLRDSITSRLISNLQTASQYIDNSELVRIEQTYAPLGFNGDETAGLEDPTFVQTIDNLRKLSSAVDAEYIYAINIKGDINTSEEFFFIFDTDEESETYVGETYGGLSDKSIEFFKNVYNNPNEEFVTFDLVDSTGNFVTGSTALTDANGNVVALLCVDVSIGFISNHRISFIITVSLLGVTLFVTFGIIALYISRLLKFNEEMQEKISHMAYYDSLTTLPNRASVLEKLEEMRELVDNDKDRHLSLALLFIDIDNFKSVNDYEGHVMGDIILQEIALFLQSHTKYVSTINNEKEYVARLGGDEFVIIYPISGAVQDKLENFSQLIVNDFKNLKDKSEILQKYNVSLSIGAAIYPKDASSISSLLKAADTAMYAVKRSGKSDYSIYKNNK